MLRKFRFVRILFSIGSIILCAFAVVPPSTTMQTELVSAQKKGVEDDNARILSSVLVLHAFDFPVIQQPAGDAVYVSSSDNLVTEFKPAKKYGNIGLLAHNQLAGKFFKDLYIGEEVRIIYQDGHSERYAVSQILRFRALNPTSTRSRFVDLNTGEILSANEVFATMYMGAPHVTFQTCIYSNGDFSWGRLFVIATPVSS